MQEQILFPLILVKPAPTAITKNHDSTLTVPSWVRVLYHDVAIIWRSDRRPFTFAWLQVGIPFSSPTYLQQIKRQRWERKQKK